MISIVIIVEAGSLSCSITNKGKRFFSSPLCPECCLGSLSL